MSRASRLSTRVPDQMDPREDSPLTLLRYGSCQGRSPCEQLRSMACLRFRSTSADTQVFDAC